MVKTANKNILQYLYKYESKWTAIDTCITDLRATNQKEDEQLAELLSEYKQMITSDFFRNIFLEIINDLSNLIEESFPNLEYRLDSREKSLIRVYDKAASLILENKNCENPLKRIHDFFALRVILMDSSPEELIDDLYEVTNKLLDFFFKNENFQILVAPAAKEVLGFKSYNFPNLAVPEESRLKDEYKKFIKDYVLNPKRNGYQSLHLIILEKRTGFTFEIQLRTHSMHLHAESSDEANHDAYRSLQNRLQEKFKNHEKIKYEKIKIRGFKATGKKDRPYDDQIGLLDSMPLLQRSKSL